MTTQLEENRFAKVDNLERWVVNFQDRHYYVFMDGGTWWVVINENGTDIKINQVGFTTFEHVRDFFNAMYLNDIIFKPLPQTAENFLEEKLGKGNFTGETGLKVRSVERLLIEFAQMHVKAALEAVLKDVSHESSIDTVSYENMKKAVLNAYPLTNIK